MKKTIIALTMAVLAAGFSACSDKGSTKCDISYKTRCSDGIYYYCEIEDGADQGGVIEAEVYVENGVEARCDKNNTLVPNSVCKNGEFINLEDTSEFVTFRSEIWKCDGDTPVDMSIHDSFCSHDGLTRYYYNASQQKYVSEKCGNGRVCDEVTRGSNSLYAYCVDAKDIQGSCDRSNTADTCSADKSTLTLCTNSGRTINVNCASMNKTCETVEKNYGNDCVFSCDNHGRHVTDFGLCDNNILYYCNSATGKYEDPITCEKSCGFVNGLYYDCID